MTRHVTFSGWKLEQPIPFAMSRALKKTIAGETRYHLQIEDEILRITEFFGPLVRR